MRGFGVRVLRATTRSVAIGRWVCLPIVLLGLLALASSAAALTDYTWSGATPTSNSNAANWSNGTNWVGGTAPSGSVGTLSFPDLTSTCSGSDTCWDSNNDVSGISADKLAIDEGNPYAIGGNSITLGASGLSATNPTNAFGPAALNLPITLGASQTWSIDGGSNSQGSIDLGGNVSASSSDTLAIAITNSVLVDVDALSGGGDVEVGPISVSDPGGGALALFGPSSATASLTRAAAKRSPLTRTLTSSCSGRAPPVH